MIFKVCLIISLILFLFGIICLPIISKKKFTKRKNFETFHLLPVTVFFSSVVIFIPVYSLILKDDSMKIIKVALLSVHNTIRLFIVDGEFDIISNNLMGLDNLTQTVYSTFAAILFVLAPILTFGAVLSLLVNTFAFQKYILNYRKDVYIFSELNDKSIALAKSIYTNNKKVLIVFTDVFENNDERSYEAINEIKAINAIYFKNDITAIRFDKHSKSADLSFVIIGKDDNENIEQCLYLSNNYSKREKTNIYLFSDSIESEYVVSSLNNTNVRIRRINEIQSLIYRTLYEKGEMLFDNAIDCEEIKIISVAIIGLGNYGTEMLRALSWLCQMEGYFLEVNCFDSDSNALSKITSGFPDLLNTEFNKYEITDQDARYMININAGFDAFTKEFDEKIDELKRTSYVFIALGNDELNIKLSAKLRKLFERRNIHPTIQTVVYDSYKKSVLKNTCNFKKQKLNIDIIGDNSTSYTDDVIFGYEIENKALERHMKWGTEESFWLYEYNYRSSVASVIHNKMKLHCRIPGSEKKLKDRTDEESVLLRKLEHRRWNAYMRSEGYSYAPARNDLAQQHNCLVPFDMLSEEDKKKDDD